MNQMTLSNISKNITLRNKQGFTLLEILVTIGIIGLLSTIVLANVIFARDKARDTKRIADLSQIGRILTFGCYKPSGGETTLDLLDLASELVSENPQYAKYLSNVPKDPRIGNDSVSGYTYIVTMDGASCALYANLERDSEKVTLTSLSDPTPGGGTGVLQGSSEGPNGSRIYYQYSN